MVNEMYVDFLEGLPGKGPIPAKYMLVGMAPSTKRPNHRKLEPFGAASWNVLNRVVGAVKGGLYVTNLVKDPVPPGKKLKKAQMEYWLPALREEVRLVKPDRIMVMGVDPCKFLLPGFDSMRQDRGTFFQGQLSKLRHDGWIIPSYHFSALGRDPAKKKYLARDLYRMFGMPDPDQADYVIIEHPDEFPWPGPGERVYLDIEATGVDVGSEITMIGLGLEEDDTTYILEQVDDDVIRALSGLFRRHGVVMVAHNASYDLMMLLHASKWNWPRPLIEDTMLMAHTAGEEVIALKSLTTLHTDLPGSRGGGGIEDPQYLAEDVRSTKAIRHKFDDVSDRFITGLLHDVVPIVSSMRLRGVYVDRPRLVQIGEDLRHELGSVDETLWKMAGVQVNFNSPQQVVKFLQDQGIKLKDRTSSGNYSAAEGTLLALKEIEDHPAIDLILKHRELAKLLSTYVDSYLDFLEYDGLLHPRLLLQGTVTGRLACRDPNAQNVPRQGPIKTAYRARWDGGLFGLVDLSQAELRVSAILSGDLAMMAALLSDDVHKSMASLAFARPPEDINSTQRKASKSVTFGLLYRGSIKGIAQRANLPKAQVAKVMAVYEREFPDLMDYITTESEKAVERGYTTSLFGRTRDLRPLILREGEWSAQRKATNTPIQSLASDLNLVILRGMEAELRRRELKSRPLFLVHDSIAAEIYPGEAEAVAECAQYGYEQLWHTPLANMPVFKDLPIEGELVVGDTWAAVESTNENYAPIAEYPCNSHGI